MIERVLFPRQPTQPADVEVHWRNLKEDGSTALHVACMKGHLDVVQCLLRYPFIDVNQRNSRGQTPFFVACLAQREDIVRTLLRDPRVNINQTDFRGCTPLWVAARDGQLSILKLMLASARGIELEKKGHNSSNPRFCSSPTDIAFHQGHTEIIQQLETYKKNQEECIKMLRRTLHQRGKFFSFSFSSLPFPFPFSFS